MYCILQTNVAARLNFAGSSFLQTAFQPALAYILTAGPVQPSVHMFYMLTRVLL